MYKHERFPGFKGKYYDLPERLVIPRSVQQPHPPLWAAASQPATFALAASRGLGVLGLTLMPPDELVPAVRAYREAQKDAKPSSPTTRASATTSSTVPVVTEVLKMPIRMRRTVVG